MKKLMTMALGLGLALGSVAFAQDKMDQGKMDDSTTKGKKAKKSKKSKKSTTDTTTPSDKKM